MTKAVFIQVGGGRVSLSSLFKLAEAVLVYQVYSSWRRPCKFNELSAVAEFYLVETTFIFWNKSSCCCSDNPAFNLVCKLPVL